jgi:hypothetical protein
MARFVCHVRTAQTAATAMAANSSTATAHANLRDEKSGEEGGAAASGWAGSGN